MKKFFITEKVRLNNEPNFTIEVLNGIITGVTQRITNGDAAAESDNNKKASLLGQAFVQDEFDSELDPNDPFDAESIEYYSSPDCPNFLRIKG